MDKQKRHQLIERYMPAAAMTAKEMDDGRMPFEDLLQEAYLGIVQAFAAEEEPGGDAVQASVRRQILLAYEEHEAARQADREIVQQMENLRESIDRLTELYGEKPNVDELANDLGVTQERVIEWLLLSGEELPENASWFALEEELSAGNENKTPIDPSAAELWFHNPEMKNLFMKENRKENKKDPEKGDEAKEK